MKFLLPYLLVLAATQCAARPRTAIVSLMVPAEDKVQQWYTNCLKVFVSSLRGVGYAGDIVVLATADTPERQKTQVAHSNVTIRVVPKISAKKVKNRSLKNMLTKLNLWDMTDYDQVMFFDSDFVFLHNPASAFHDCGKNDFCACSDTGISGFSHGRLNGNTYFNSGFMVVRPSREQFKYLKASAAAAENTDFVDQDMLNHVYQRKWKKLDSKYNLMHVNGPISSTTVAIHEKLWIMQQKYPTGNWIWNKARDTVSSIQNEGRILRRKVPALRQKLKNTRGVA